MIKLENVHKSFGKNEVLKGIDLHIEKGQVVVIIGPSGSGKSTVLRTMNYLEEPTSGKVIVDGMAQSIVETRIQREVFVRECSRPSTCHSGSQIAHYLAVERINDAVSIDILPANISRFDGFPAC